jgi:hypothetical protein
LGSRSTFFITATGPDAVDFSRSDDETTPTISSPSVTGRWWSPESRRMRHAS